MKVVNEHERKLAYCGKCNKLTDTEIYRWVRRFRSIPSIQRTCYECKTVFTSLN